MKEHGFVKNLVTRPLFYKHNPVFSLFFPRVGETVIRQFMSCYELFFMFCYELFLCSVMSSGHEFLLAIEALTPPPLPPDLNPYSFTGKTRPGPGGGKIDIATVSCVHSMNYWQNQFYFLLSCSSRIWVFMIPKSKQPIPSKVYEYVMMGRKKFVFMLIPTM